MGERRVPESLRKLISLNLTNGLLFIILSAAFLIYLVTLTPAQFGAYYDDSIYVTTAKALASNQGYKIISLPHEPAQTLYPPFYPFLLSVIWRIYPGFPENVVWMMLLSLVATVSFLGLSYRYLTGMKYLTAWQALAVIAIAGINWRTMLLATTLLSELTFAALSIGSLLLAEKYETDRAGRVAGTIVGVVMGLAFLTRSSGISLVIAFGVYCLLRKQWQRALVPVGVASLFVIVWAGWCYLSRNTAAGLNAGYFTSYWHMFSESFQSLRVLNDSSPVATLLHIIGTNFLLLVVASPPLACFGIRYDFPSVVVLLFVLLTFITIVIGFLKRFKMGLRLLDIYVCSYLVVHLIPAGVAYDRYLLPIVPLLLYYIISEAGVFTASVRMGLSSEVYSKKILASFGVLAFSVICVTLLYSNATAIYESIATLRKRTTETTVDMGAIEWVSANTTPSAVLVCYRDPMFYLHTGRKSVISSPIILFNTTPYHSRKPNSDELRAAFLRLVNESEGEYLILAEEDFRFESDDYRRTIDKLLEENKERFIPVFNTLGGRSTIYRIERPLGK